MKLVEIANYYCPEKQTKQGVTQENVAPRADLGLAGGRLGYRDPLENVL